MEEEPFDSINVNDDQFQLYTRVDNPDYLDFVHSLGQDIPLNNDDGIIL